MSEATGRSWHEWFLVFVAALATAVVLVGLKDDAVGFDLATVYVPAADDVLDGVSPYPADDDPVWQGHQAYVYPPLTAFVSLPLTLLSSPALEYVGVLAALAIMLLAIWLVGVRDPRCYAVFLLWPPTMTAWQNANVSALLVLACALAWRFRDSWRKEGAALGLGVALKLVLWPLGLWLLATRRIHGVVAAAVVAVFAILASWAVIGFKGFASYPDLLRRLTDVESENGHSISVYSAVLAAGGPADVAQAVSLAVAVAFAIAALAYGRQGDDRASFLLALLAALAFPPVGWLHYQTMLVVPLAIYRPRLSGLWLTPLLFWAIAVPGWPFEPRRLVAFVVVTVIVARLLSRPTAVAHGTSPPPAAREPVVEGVR